MASELEKIIANWTRCHLDNSMWIGELTAVILVFTPSKKIEFLNYHKAVRYRFKARDANSTDNARIVLNSDGKAYYNYSTKTSSGYYMWVHGEQIKDGRWSFSNDKKFVIVKGKMEITNDGARKINENGKVEFRIYKHNDLDDSNVHLAKYSKVSIQTKVINCQLHIKLQYQDKHPRLQKWSTYINPKTGFFEANPNPPPCPVTEWEAIYKKQDYLKVKHALDEGYGGNIQYDERKKCLILRFFRSRQVISVLFSIVP